MCHVLPNERALVRLSAMQSLLQRNQLCSHMVYCIKRGDQY